MGPRRGSADRSKEWQVLRHKGHKRKNWSALLALLMPLMSQASASPESALDEAIALCLQGQASAAHQAFAALQAQYHPPPGILAVIDYYLHSGCHGAQLQAGGGGWLAEWSLGHNTNVNQGMTHDRLQLDGLPGSPVLSLSDSARPQGDHFGQVRLRRLQPGWQLGIGLRQYAQLHNYHQASMDAAWQSDALALQLYATTLGGDLYQSAISLAWMLPVPGTDWQAGVKLQQHRYPNQPVYDDLALEPFLFRRMGAWGLYLAASVDTPDPRRPGGRRQGILSMLTYTQSLADQALLESTLYWHHQWEADAFSPGLLNARRDHWFGWWQLRYTQPVSTGHAWFVESQLTYSDDRIPLYDYQGALLALGWQMRW